MSESNGFTTVKDWRSLPGYIINDAIEFESVHSLLGYFLKDRNSPNPLPEKSLFKDGKFEWGEHQPLEKVIRNPEDLKELFLRPYVSRNSVCIIEPWVHVGVNDQGEEVRASKNIAYIMQKIANADSILFPIWATGALDTVNMIEMMCSSLAVVVEGGEPSAYDPESFGEDCSGDDMFRVIERLLLSRSPISAPAIFICLGHQLAAEAHIRLLKNAVRAILDTHSLSSDHKDEAIQVLRQIARRIEEMGERISIMKDGKVIGKGWKFPQFAVAPNEQKEVGKTRLQRYHSPNFSNSHVPFDVIYAHDLMSDELDGIIDTMIEYEKDIHISMFHSDEVNEEAILFANWAYRTLHDAIVPYRHVVSASHLAWLMQMPYAVEIIASTAADGAVLTEASATCINYKDFETHRYRRSFTVQFHPELLEDLREIGRRGEVSYEDLKQDDGMRLLTRLLYVGMQE
jgi:hypothetical protein